MGKVKNETPAAKTAKPVPRGGNRVVSMFTPFLANLVRSDSYKAQQGWYARLWTAIGLSLLVLAGVYRLYETQLHGETSLPVQYGVPVALLCVLGWLIYRIVQYPPFVDFLIATEAEMNKVSWTSKAELKRATTVVLATVLILAVYLFVVDWVWIYLLRMIHVLNTGDTGDFGSQAG
jgi:preprotein translocase subunit SecE